MRLIERMSSILLIYERLPDETLCELVYLCVSARGMSCKPFFPLQVVIIHRTQLSHKVA